MKFEFPPKNLANPPDRQKLVVQRGDKTQLPSLSSILRRANTGQSFCRRNQQGYTHHLEAFGIESSSSAAVGVFPRSELETNATDLGYALQRIARDGAR